MILTDLYLDVPDARLPVILTRPSSRTRLRWVGQNDRRAQVLATTRKRIEELGFEKVTLRMLAADCGVSVQTIFNLVGNRSQVFRGALNDLGGLIDLVAKKAGDHYPAYPIAYADTIWHLAMRNPECLKRLTLTQFSFGSAFSNDVRDCAAALLRNALKEMHGRMRSNMDLRLITESIASTQGAAMLEWAYDMYDIYELRRKLLYGVSLVLMGAMVSTEADKIEEWLSESSSPYKAAYEKSSRGAQIQPKSAESLT